MFIFSFTKEHGHRNPPVFGTMQREGTDLANHMHGWQQGRRALMVPLVLRAPRPAHGHDRVPRAGEGKLLKRGHNLNL